MLKISGRGWTLGLAIICLAGCHHRQAGQPQLVLTPVAAHERAAEKYEKTGDEYFQRHRIPEAIKAWQLALELDPQRTDLLARIRTAQNTEDLPVPAVSASSSIEQHILQVLTQAEQHYRHSRLPAAELAWQRALELSPGNSEAKAGLERLRLEAYQSDPQRSFDRMTADLYQQGMGAYRLQDYAQAEARLSEAAKLNPQQPQVQCMLARVAKLQQEEKLEENLRQRSVRAREAEAKHAWIEAYQQWLSILRTLPGRAEALEGKKRTHPYVLAWAQSQVQAGNEALGRGEYDQAINSFQLVLDLLPEHAEAKRGKSQADAGWIQYQQQTSLNRQAQARFQKGVELYQAGHWEQAMGIWQQAVTADPGDTQSREWLARVQKEHAGEQADRLRRAEARYADGLAAYQRGELDEALAAWRETLELNPNHDKAQINIRQVERELK